MGYDIRQLSFAEVLDRSLRILVDNAMLLIGVAIFLGMPMEALPRGRGWPEVLAGHSPFRGYRLLERPWHRQRRTSIWAEMLLSGAPLRPLGRFCFVTSAPI